MCDVDSLSGVDVETMINCHHHFNYSKRMALQQKGFTLIELLVVIAIIGILVAVVFVALDPETRLKQARDAVRQNDVQTVLSAIKLYQADHAGSYPASIERMNAGEVSMIVEGTLTTGCDDYNAACDTAVTADEHCVSLKELAEEDYLKKIPVSPAGKMPWDSESEERTGYTLERDTAGVIHVRSCESEDATEISVSL